MFLREVGAVDNRVYRQFAGCDTLKASAKLSMLRDAGLLEMKGRGKATCYVPGDRFPIANIIVKCDYTLRRWRDGCKRVREGESTLAQVGKEG